MEEQDRIELILVDEYPVVRAGVRTILESEWGMHVVGEADSVDAAADMIRDQKPDVVVMDLDLSEAGLMEGVQRVHAESIDSAVVILSHRDRDEDLYQAVVAGASGHVAEASEPSMLADTIRQAAGGKDPISLEIARRPTVSQRVLERYRQLSQISLGPGDTEMPLNTRERVILRHVAQGLTNRQIGRAMGMSENTVKAAVSSILRKLGLRHRTEAVVFAIRRGWITVPGANGDET
jgi:DNA-binding NarL/FixJ family response regulator